MNKRISILFAAIAVAVFFALAVPMASATPYDASGSSQSNETHNSTIGQAVGAAGGNITYIDLDVLQQTSKWQGYYGNVTGTITLDDSSDKTMYNWSISTPSGEVLATTNTSIPVWTDFSSTTAAEIDTVWSFGSDTDNATGTFTLNNTAAINISGQTAAVAGDTTAQHTYVNDAVNTTIWETAVLECKDSPDAKGDFVFVGIINNDQTSYANTTCDFQMIVPESPDTTTTTTYYFYVELT